ncbi:MAG TPA: hypothetical protein VK461_06030 [Acidimicrobiales bacterium]|nr:hypothetical protein [Acidimicrobiales bacterium]
MPAADDANLARLADALRSLDARLRVLDDPDGLAFDPHPALLRSMAMLNLTTRCGDLDVAFSPAALDDYDELAARAEVFDIGALTVKVAALADIIRSKEAAARPKDHATLPVLRALAEETRSAIVTPECRRPRPGPGTANDHRRYRAE